MRESGVEFKKRRGTKNKNKEQAPETLFRLRSTLEVVCQVSPGAFTAPGHFGAPSGNFFSFFSFFVSQRVQRFNHVMSGLRMGLFVFMPCLVFRRNVWDARFLFTDSCPTFISYVPQLCFAKFPFVTWKLLLLARSIYTTALIPFSLFFLTYCGYARCWRRLNIDGSSRPSFESVSNCVQCVSVCLVRKLVD